VSFTSSGLGGGGDGGGGSSLLFGMFIKNELYLHSIWGEL